jgi:multiple sugar transport system substrate-binding protein
MTEADAVVIPRGARHPDEAFEFIKFLQSQKGLELLNLLQGKHSPLMQVSPQFYEKHPNPYIKLFYELPKNKSAFAVPAIGIWPELRDSMIAAFEQVLLMQKTPKQALDDVQGRMQPKFEEYMTRKRMRQEAMDN